MSGSVALRFSSTVTHADVAQLMDFDAGRTKAITIYADTRAEEGIGRRFGRKVRNALDQPQKLIGDSSERLAAFADSRELAEEALADPAAAAGQGLALFVCASRGMAEAFALPSPFHTRVVLARRLYVPPLARTVETFDTHIVAHVRSDRANVYTAYMHRLWPVLEIANEVPGRMSAGGRSQSRYQRHREEHIRRHVKEVADEVTALVDEEGADRLLLFGPADVLDALGRRLPDATSRRILSREQVAAEAGEPEIRDRCRDILHKYRDNLADETLEELSGRVATSNRAAAGISDVLEALRRRAVEAVIIPKGLVGQASYCSECGWIEADGPEICPSCDENVGRSLLPTQLARAARDQGAGILFIEDPAKMVPFGGVAAYLRY